MKFEKPKFIATPEEYQQAPDSIVVSGAIVNCSCGSLKNTVKLVVQDRGSDAGGSPICMSIDREETNFSETFGICSKTGEQCVLTQMHEKWHIPAKVPAYIKWIPKPKPRGNYTVADTNLVAPVALYSVVFESSLLCWHHGSAGLITIYKNGQVAPGSLEYWQKNINDNPLMGYTLDPTMIGDYSGAGPYGLALLALVVLGYTAEYTLNNPPQNVPGRSLPKEYTPPPSLTGRPSSVEAVQEWYDLTYGADRAESEELESLLDLARRGGGKAGKKAAGTAGSKGGAATGAPDPDDEDEDSNSDSKESKSYKQVKNNKEANKVAKKLGYEGERAPEDLKADHVGKNDGSQFEMYIDTETGEVVLINHNTGVEVPTGEFVR